jgi:hypothetical protein
MSTMRAADGQKLAEEHLALANRHITQAKERIARQQALIQRIAAAGWDTSLAGSLLEGMQHARASRSTGGSTTR